MHKLPAPMAPFLGGLLLVLTLQTSAGDDPAEAIAYLTEENRPLNYSENGKPAGLAVDLLRLVWQRMGVAAQPIHVVPWPRAYNSGRLEGRTMIFSMFRTKDREPHFKWVGPIVDGRVLIYARRDRRLRADSPRDLRDLHLGTVRDEAATTILRESGVPFSQAHRPDNAVRMLAEGRLDALAVNEYQFRYTVAELGLPPDDFESILTLSQGAFYYALSQDTPDQLIRRFQDALDAVRGTPAYLNLLNLHLH